MWPVFVFSYIYIYIYIYITSIVLTLKIQAASIYVLTWNAYPQATWTQKKISIFTSLLPIKYCNLLYNNMWENAYITSWYSYVLHQSKKWNKYVTCNICEKCGMNNYIWIHTLKKLRFIPYLICRIFKNKS